MAGEGPDVGAQMARFAALTQQMQVGGNGGKQGWADGAICKGAQSLTITNCAPAKGSLPTLAGTGRGMFGGAGDKLTSVVQSIGDAFLKSLQNTGIQPASIQEARIETPNFGGGGGFADRIQRGGDGGVGAA